MEITINDHEINIFGTPNATRMMILVGDREPELLQQMADGHTVLVSFSVEDWNRDLSPWSFHMNKNFDFAGKGRETLDWLMNQVIPAVTQNYPSIVRKIICGYSLGGLFALYAYYETGSFVGAGSFSGSLWFDGWDEYISRKKAPDGTFVYLSLGDREAVTRNQVMAKVMDRTVLQKQVLESQNINCIFEINPGNHFADHRERISKGIRWLLNNVS